MADYMNNNVIDRELDWGDSIEHDSPEFILLEEGEYTFTVDHFEKDRHPGSEKLPPCNKAVLYLNVETPNGTATVRHNLFLHTRTEGMVCAFFTAIGQRQHGQRVTMNWAAVPGAQGRAKIGVREYNGKKYNEVKRFLEPAAAVAPAPGAYQPAQPAYPQQAPAYPPNSQGYQQPAYQPPAQGYAAPNTQGFQPPQGASAGQGWASGKF